jgi:hypothetical protein
MAFLVMCAEKILRLVRLLFVHIFACFYCLLGLFSQEAMSSNLYGQVASNIGSPRIDEGS